MFNRRKRFVDSNQGIKRMSRLYSLSYMTLETSPPKMIEFAAEAGYDLAGIRMMPSFCLAAWPFR